MQKVWKIMGSHPKDQIIGDMSQRVTRTFLKNLCDHSAFLSHFETKSVNEALNDES